MTTESPWLFPLTVVELVFGSPLPSSSHTPPSNPGEPDDDPLPPSDLDWSRHSRKPTISSLYPFHSPRFNRDDLLLAFSSRNINDATNWIGLSPGKSQTSSPVPSRPSYLRMGSFHRNKSNHWMDIKGKGFLYEDDDEPINLTDQDTSHYSIQRNKMLRSFFRKCHHNGAWRTALPLTTWGIGSRLGHVHQDTIELMEGIMLIDIDTRRPLKFARKAESPEGDEVTIEIKYEMLFKHCSTCGEPPWRLYTGQVPEVRSQYQPVKKEPQKKAQITSSSLSYSDHKSRHFNDSRYGHSERSYDPEFASSRDESRGHADRIIRRRSDLSRSSRYGGSVTGTRDVVSYGQTSAPISNDSRIHERKSSERKSTWEAQATRRLASTIVTPSRIDHDIDENVTKCFKGSPRSLTFSTLSAKELMPVDGDDLIIDALNDMDIAEQQDGGMMDCEVQNDDLMGLELVGMEDKAVQDVTHKSQKTAVKASKGSKYGSKPSAPLGIQNKKIEILLRGSPHKSRKALSEWRKQHNVNSSRLVEELKEKVEDGSWTPTAQFSGCRWVWIDSMGKAQLMGTRNHILHESPLHSEVEALQWAMENMLQHSTCQSFRTYCKELIAMIKEPCAWPSFATELERIETLQICFPDFRSPMFHAHKIRF
ncbi:hypothetical protein DY000_02004767 [Brassica cretica]|uniref:Uncharacterized protein n=1 Tax=Brassica cretica TaxID=69181 RepID=A0ABQ7CHM9_BRACR|nr:hypothetical protein DY000_02004767 [Brassica cretica]